MIMKRAMTTHQRKWHCNHIAGILIILCVIFPTFYSQTIINKPANDEFQCPGQVVVITCVTRGSFLITWRSIQYIGANRIEFSTNSNEGAVNVFSNITTASLTRNAMENGVQVLESQLRIIVGSNVPSPSVTCARDSGNADSVTLRVLVDPPDMGNINIISDQRRLNSTEGCFVHYSWTLPSNVTLDTMSHFVVSFNRMHAYNEIINKSWTIYTRAHHVCTCDTHNISVVAIDHCGRPGQSIIHFVNDPEPMTDTMCEPDFVLIRPDTGCASEDLNKPTIILVVLLVPSLCGILVLTIVLILTCCGVIPIPQSCCPCEREKRKVNDNQSHEMHPTNATDGDTDDKEK